MVTPINKVTITLTEDLSGDDPVLGCDVSGDVDESDGSGLTTIGMAAAFMVASLADHVKSVEYVERDDVQH